VPPTITLLRWVNEKAFVAERRLDLAPPTADRFILGFPIDYGPVLLLMPFGFPGSMHTIASPSPPLRSWEPLQAPRPKIELSTKSATLGETFCRQFSLSRVISKIYDTG
jgi:hypothetical protein